jgi:hypothetical protein
MKPGEYPPPAEEPQEPERGAGAGGGPSIGATDALITDSVEALAEYVRDTAEDPRIRAINDGIEERGEAWKAAWKAQSQGLHGAERDKLFGKLLEEFVEAELSTEKIIESHEIYDAFEAEHLERWRQRHAGEPDS